jgi:hypothetical protein
MDDPGLPSVALVFPRFLLFFACYLSLRVLSCPCWRLGKNTRMLEGPRADKLRVAPRIQRQAQRMTFEV